LVKVLIVGHSLAGGGAEFVTREWIRFLVKSGDEVDFLSLDANAQPAQHLEGARQLFAADAKATSHLKKISFVRKSIREGAYDVCLAMQTYPNLITLMATRALSSRPRTVISERNMPSILLRQLGRSHRAQLFVAARTYRHADAMIAISHPVAANVVVSLGVAQENCFVVPNPATAKSSSQPIRQPSHPEGELTLVLPFRLVNQKRPLLAIDVAAELATRGHKVKVLSYGRGPLEDRMTREAAEKNVDFQFAGWHENWFDNCPPGSVVVLPSNTEGFGNVLVEAASRGIPSVAWSGALGVADAIVPGVTGEFSASGSAQGFADAVERLSATPIDVPAGWLAYFSVESSGARMREVLALQK
jgi:glycosyltransferase involved in cell wall biosynthesis